MTVQITLPDSITQRLQRRANALQITLAELVIKLLGEALPDEPDNLDFLPSHTQTIQRIRALPPNSEGIIAPTQSVEQLLASFTLAPPTTDLFTYQEWQPLWSQFEQALKTTTQADALADIQRASHTP